MRRTSLFAAACSVTLAATLIASPSQASGGSSEPEVVASGLVGPLSVAVHDKSGKTYVTQSFAGLLSRVNKDGTTTTLVADPNGPNGEIVGVSLGPKGTYFIQSDYSGATPTSYVKRIDSKGRVKTVSKDLWAYEIAKNPDGNKAYGFTKLSDSCAADLAAFETANPGGPPLSRYTGIIESHAYQTTVHKGNVYVADAAANAVLKVDGKSGKIRTVAVIPATPVKFTADIKAMIEGMLGGVSLPDCLVDQKYVPEPVPTDVKVGKDGKLYVTTLGGGLGEALPLSSVYRVDAKSGKAKKVTSGLFGATGLDFVGKHIVVAEMFGNEVSIIKNGKGQARTLFALPGAADVDAKGSTIYATSMTGDLVKYRR